MNKSSELDRLMHKSLDGQFIWELENGFELSPKASELILDTVHLYFCQGRELLNNRVNLWVVKKDSSVGKPLNELEKIKVLVTLDGGQEDLEVYEKFGLIELRRQKILRVTDEVLDQGGIVTQEDLSRLLGSSIRTIRRDISYLRSEGFRVITRGVYSDIGPTVSHKIIIIKLFLKNYSYTEICRQTRHSAKAVQRYITSFGRVVVIYERGITDHEEISSYSGLSMRLVGEYVDIYLEHKKSPTSNDRLKDLLKQLSSRSPYKDVLDGELKKRALEDRA